MNKNKFQKGFTLIELLVVIAIIGILASILLVNLASTRNKAKDAGIKLEMGQIRTAMENHFSTGTTYVGGLATADVVSLRADIVAKGGAATLAGESVGAYCVEYSLNAPSGSWCVDSTGYAGATANCQTVATDYDCN